MHPLQVQEEAGDIVESSADVIRARSELLRTMNLSLMKACTTAVRGADAAAHAAAAAEGDATSDEDPDEDMRQAGRRKQQKQNQGDRRRMHGAGGEEDEDEDVAECSPLSKQVMRELSAAAAEAVKMHEAISRGSAHLLPCAWVSAPLCVHASWLSPIAMFSSRHPMRLLCPPHLTQVPTQTAPSRNARKHLRLTTQLPLKDEHQHAAAAAEAAAPLCPLHDDASSLDQTLEALLSATHPPNSSCSAATVDTSGWAEEDGSCLLGGSIDRAPMCANFGIGGIGGGVWSSQGDDEEPEDLLEELDQVRRLLQDW
jgi:hypothetical protein